MYYELLSAGLIRVKDDFFLGGGGRAAQNMISVGTLDDPF